MHNSTMARFLVRARQANVITSIHPPVQIGDRRDHARPYFHVPIPAVCMASP